MLVKKDYLGVRARENDCSASERERAISQDEQFENEANRFYLLRGYMYKTGRTTIQTVTSESLYHFLVHLCGQLNFALRRVLFNLLVKIVAVS